MTKKILLKTRSEPAVYTLIGIACHLMDYRFLYWLNCEPGFNFIKEADLKIGFPGLDHSVAFSFSSYYDEDHRNSYYLVSNFSGVVVLLSEFRQIDFILLIEGDFKKKQKDALMAIIRSIPKVLTAYEIKLTDIKNAESFLTDVEMHVSEIRQEIKSKKISLI